MLNVDRTPCAACRRHARQRPGRRRSAARVDLCGVAAALEARRGSRSSVAGPLRAAACGSPTPRVCWSSTPRACWPRSSARRPISTPCTARSSVTSRSRSFRRRPVGSHRRRVRAGAEAPPPQGDAHRARAARSRCRGSSAARSTSCSRSTGAMRRWRCRRGSPRRRCSMMSPTSPCRRRIASHEARGHAAGSGGRALGDVACRRAVSRLAGAHAAHGRHSADRRAHGRRARHAARARRRGPGACVIPRLGRDAVPRGVSIVRVKPALTRHVYALWRADATRRPGVRATVEAFQAEGRRIAR